jgi:hypothetical protein
MSPKNSLNGKMTLRLTAILALLLVSLAGMAQPFARKYESWWGATEWDFQFNLDGTWVRTSNGHFGNTTFTGTYSVEGDTLRILTGYAGTAGTVCSTYLLIGDSVLFDLCVMSDYYLDGIDVCGAGGFESGRKIISFIHKDIGAKTADTFKTVVGRGFPENPASALAASVGWPAHLSPCSEIWLSQSTVLSPNYAAHHIYNDQKHLTKFIYDDSPRANGTSAALLFLYEPDPKTDLRNRVHKIKDTGTGEVYEFFYNPEGGLDKIAKFNAKGKLVEALIVHKVLR